MNSADTPVPVFDTMLTELAALGMRAARVVVRVMEIEQAAADVVAQWLPAPGPPSVSLEGLVADGQSVDAVEAQLAAAVPRLETMARALDRVSRSVRRSIALLRRMQAGWPRGAPSDDRQAMVRRQVARGVAEVIARESDGETAERLFDDLAERLDVPGLDAELDALPVEEIVRRICHDIGLAGDALRAISPVTGEAGRPAAPPGAGGGHRGAPDGEHRPPTDTC